MNRNLFFLSAAVLLLLAGCDRPPKETPISSSEIASAVGYPATDGFGPPARKPEFQGDVAEKSPDGLVHIEGPRAASSVSINGVNVTPPLKLASWASFV